MPTTLPGFVFQKVRGCYSRLPNFPETSFHPHCRVQTCKWIIGVESGSRELGIGAKVHQEVPTCKCKCVVTIVEIFKAN